MKKCIVVLVLLTGISTQAHAEHKLLVTDILDKGQSEISASISYSHSHGNFTDMHAIDMLGMNPRGTVKSDTTVSTVSAAVGLGPGIQFSASIPYVSYRTTYTLDTFPQDSTVSKREGLGDPKIGVRGLVFAEKTAPVTLVAGLDLKLDWQDYGHGGTGTTNIAPYVALSKKVTPEARLYAAYAPVIRNHGASDSHTLFAGIEQTVSQRVTVVAEGAFTFWNNGDYADDTNAFGAALAAYFQLHGNLYLIPSFGASMMDSYDTKDARFHYGKTSTLGGAMELYYLF